MSATAGMRRVYWPSRPLPPASPLGRGSVPGAAAPAAALRLLGGGRGLSRRGRLGAGGGLRSASAALRLDHGGGLVVAATRGHSDASTDSERRRGGDYRCPLHLVPFLYASRVARQRNEISTQSGATVHSSFLTVISTLPSSSVRSTGTPCASRVASVADAGWP